MPSDETLTAYYARYSYDQHGLDNVPAVVFEWLRPIVGRFAPFRRSGRLLDVGFGSGAVLQASKSAGWHVHGIEKSALAVSQAREHGFADTIEGDFLDDHYPDGHFDVVVMYETVEHLPDPQAFFRQALRVLRPGGLLFLSTPNGAGISCRLMGDQWFVVCPPEHLQLFSPRSMTVALRSANFSSVKVDVATVDPYPIIDWLRRKQRSEPLAASDPRSPQTLNRKLTGNPLGRLVKRAANTVLNQSRLGDSLKVCAIR